jgi:hypothetical protein
MKCSKFETLQNRNQNTITWWYKGLHQPYNAKSSAAAHEAGSQLSSQSSSLPLGHTHLPLQLQYSGISAHIYIHKQSLSN